MQWAVWSLSRFLVDKHTFPSSSVPSIQNNTIAQSAGWQFNCNSCGSGVYKKKNPNTPLLPVKNFLGRNSSVFVRSWESIRLTPLPYGTSLSLGCIKGLYRIIKVPCSGSSEAAFQVGAPALLGSACAWLLLMPRSEKCYLALLSRAAGMCVRSWGCCIGPPRWNGDTFSAGEGKSVCVCASFAHRGLHLEKLYCLLARKSLLPLNRVLVVFWRCFSNSLAFLWFGPAWKPVKLVWALSQAVMDGSLLSTCVAWLVFYQFGHFGLSSNGWGQGRAGSGDRRWQKVVFCLLYGISCWCLVFGLFSQEGVKRVSACWPSFLSSLWPLPIPDIRAGELLLHSAMKMDVADN